MAKKHSASQAAWIAEQKSIGDNYEAPLNFRPFDDSFGQDADREMFGSEVAVYGLENVGYKD